MDICSKAINVLKHRVALIREYKDDKKYLAGVLTKVIPLIRIIAPTLHGQWLRANEECIKRRAKLESLAVQEFKDAFALLESSLIKEGLVQDSLIQKNMKSLKDLFAGLPNYIMPPPSRIAYDNFSGLCNRLCDMGKIDLIMDFVQIRYIEKYQAIATDEYVCICCGFVYGDEYVNKNSLGLSICFDDLALDWFCPICKSSKKSFRNYERQEWIEVADIDRFTVAPSYLELMELNWVVAWKQNSPVEPWVAYGYLKQIESHYGLSRDYFR